MPTVRMKVNGSDVGAEIEARTLLSALRAAWARGGAYAR